MLLRSLFIFLLSAQLYSKECAVSISKHGSSKDCIKCAFDPIPENKGLDSVTKPLSNFFTDKDSQVEKVDRFKSYLKFLENKENQKQCSNYKNLMSIYKQEFLAELKACEKGPEKLDRNKIICEWALNHFNEQMRLTIENQIYEPSGTKGLLQFIKGRTLQHMDGPIRAQFNWCTNIMKTYKQRIFVSCGELDSWVKELNLVKKVGDAMKRDMAASLASSEVSTSPEQDRKKVFAEACKYFDKNPATNFTKDFLLSCIASDN